MKDIFSSIKYRTFTVYRNVTNGKTSLDNPTISLLFEIGKVTVASIPMNDKKPYKVFRLGMSFVRTERNNETKKIRDCFNRKVGQKIACLRLIDATESMLVSLNDEDRTLTELLRSEVIYNYAQLIGENGVSWMFDKNIIIR